MLYKVNVLGSYDAMSSFKPKKSNPPNVLNRFQAEDEGAKSFRGFQSPCDKSNTFPSPSKIAQAQRSKEKVATEKPKLPIVNDLDLKESLSKITLKKTGLLDGNEGAKNEYEKESVSVNNSEPCNKPIGKLNINKFENLQPSVASSQKGKISEGFVGNKPPLMQKPVLKNDNQPIKPIKPKPMKKNIFPPEPEPDFPAPPGELYDDVDATKMNTRRDTRLNSFQKKSDNTSPPNIRPKPASIKKVQAVSPEKVWRPPAVSSQPLAEPSISDEIYEDVVNTDTINTHSIQTNGINKDESASTPNIRPNIANMNAWVPPAPPPQHFVEQDYTEEIYEDVDTTVVMENHLQTNTDRGEFDDEEEDGEAIYDSVENVIDTESLNCHVFSSTHPISNVAAEADEIYDDVADHSPVVQEDIYDDVDQNAMSLAPTYPSHSLLQNDSKYKSDLYLAPADGSNNSILPNSSPSTNFMSQVYPTKPAKMFADLDASRFAVPYGLDTWLYHIICANQFKLQENGMSAEFYDRYAGGTDFPGIAVSKKTANDLDTTSIKSTDSKQEKENKKEKKRLKQLEKEKKAKEQQKQKRMEKDLKCFNLDLNKERTIIGHVCASSEFKGSKKDLAYQYGDEIEILQTSHECPPGKVLAQNVSTTRIGYITKSDFQLDDSIFPDAKARVSLIPTEDEEGLYPGYEDTVQQAITVPIARRPVGAPPLPTIPPPPPPQTPRPLIKPVPVPVAVITPEEDIYAECGDIIGDLVPSSTSTLNGHTEEVYEVI